MCRYDLLARARRLGHEALVLMNDLAADLEQVAVLVAERQELLSAARAALERLTPDEREAEVEQLFALQRQQSELAEAGARRREHLHTALCRIREASSRLRALQEATHLTTAPRLLDRRF